MFGYVLALEDQLTPEAWQRYRGAYCGLCRTLGERYGTVSQFILNYDLTFLAILLADPAQPEIRHGRWQTYFEKDGRSQGHLLFGR